MGSASRKAGNTKKERYDENMRRGFADKSNGYEALWANTYQAHAASTVLLWLLAFFAITLVVAMPPPAPSSPLPPSPSPKPARPPPPHPMPPPRVPEPSLSPCREVQPHVAPRFASHVPAPLPPLPPPPPPNPPPAIRPPGQVLVDQLNARFAEGRPSNDLLKAGVLIRQFDGLENQARPWEPCQPNQWCHVYRDRFATTLVNSKQPLLYSRTAGGFILNPAVVRILCAYYADGGSQKKQCNPPGVSKSCTPGCARTCSELRDFRGCSWPPEQFQEMMEQQQLLHAGGGHNEVIVDGDRWVTALPSIISAVVMVDTESDTSTSKQAWTFTRKAHEDFIRFFDLNPANLPLVQYDTSLKRPFHLLSN